MAEEFEVVYHVINSEEIEMIDIRALQAEKAKNLLAEKKIEELTNALKQALDFIGNYSYPKRSDSQIKEREKGFEIYCAGYSALTKKETI